MDASLRSLDFAEVLELLALEIRTGPGKRRLLGRRPVHSQDEAERLQSELREMTNLYLDEGLLPFAGLEEIDSFLASGGSDLEQSWTILRAVKATQALREAILRSDREHPHLSRIAARIEDLDELIRSTNRFFTRDGKLREDASPQLKRIRQKIHSRRNETQRVLTDLMNRRSESVQEPIITMRGDRYCIPVRSEKRSAVPGILHERSGSGASAFIEPLEVVEMNNEIADLLLAERDEIRRIERFISDQIAIHKQEIAASIDAASELDAIQACAVVGSKLEASRPTFSTSNELRIVEGRHPLLDERVADLREIAFGEEPSDRRVVAVSIDLSSDERGLVISGPNAGGKTVSLKTAGLLTAMAASGLPVPAADGTTLPLPDQIHLLIGDDQDLLEHLSTFSAYLTRLKRILSEVTSDSLVLLDEIGSGTDPEEGSAIASAVIEHLVEVGPLFIVTTHLARVQSLAIASDRIVNASMEFGEDSHEPTFRLIPGLPGRSRAIEVAERVGLPAPILEKAREVLGDDYGKTDQLLSQLQSSLREAQALRDELEQRERDLRQKEREVAAHVESVRKEEKSLLRKWQEESDAIRRDVYRQLRGELKALREKSQAERDGSSVDDVAEKVLEPASRRPEPETITPDSVDVGDIVRHRRFGFEGALRSIDGERVEVLVKGKKMQLDLADLEIVRKGDVEAKPSRKKKRPRQILAPSGVDPEVSAELNLIGQRVEEALEESDRFLDRALLEGRGAVRLIHGHGTGRLKEAVREHLRTHPAVRKWRPGGEREGGDGATIAILDR